MNCRSCGTKLNKVFVNLGAMPLSNRYKTVSDIDGIEKSYPLRVFICETCWLAQVEDFVKAEDIFDCQYPYFSSCTSDFVNHAREYVSMITEKLQLDSNSLVYEAGSNDGYLLQFFKDKGIPCCGIDPSESVSRIAINKGIETRIEYFTSLEASHIAQTKGKADLFIGNNVVAHTQNINDFIQGIKIILTPNGVATLEFPHLLKTMKNIEFDTIYHEHFSYFSLTSISSVLNRNFLKIFKVEEMDIHGGSLRVYITHSESNVKTEQSVLNVLSDEKKFGLENIETYLCFQEKIDELCKDFLNFITIKKSEGSKIIGYGAAAKGNTLLNYCGIDKTVIDFVADVTPMKIGKILPQSKIPTVDESMILESKPDYIVILPWNWKDSIINRLSYCRRWGAKFVIAVPELKVF